MSKPDLSERLKAFLDVAAGEGYEFAGVDAADLFFSLFGDDGNGHPAAALSEQRAELAPQPSPGSGELPPLRAALLEVAASHAWQCFGECRAYHDMGKTGPALPPSEADALARAALAAAPAGSGWSGAQVPDGWKLVPIEPTQAMLDAGCDCVSLFDYEAGERRSWAAMLAVAPAAALAAKPGSDAQDGSNEGNEMKFKMHVAGPDDLHYFDTELEALREANKINKAYLADCLKHPNPEDHVLCVATVEPGSDAQDGRDAARYRWLREQHEGHDDMTFDADGLPQPMEPTALAFTVFRPDPSGCESLVPVGCIPGELDDIIDAAMAASPSGEVTR